MSLSFAQFVLLLGLPWICGVLLLRAAGIGPRGFDLAFAGWSLASGLLTAAILVFVFLWLGLPLRERPLQFAMLGIAVLALGIRLRQPWPPQPTPLPVVVGSRLGRTLFALSVTACVVLVVARALEGDMRLIVLHDEAHIYAAKAKALYWAGDLGARFREVTRLVEPYEHFDYPPLDSLLQVWTFAHVGAITHFENRLPVQAAMLALVLVSAGALRRVVRPSIAALLLPLLYTLPHAQMMMKTTHADHLVALGFLMAVEAWLLWSATRDPRWWRLCCIGLGLLFWSKNEGTMLAGCFGLAVLADPAWRASFRRPRELAWLVLPVALVIAHHASNAAFGFANDLTQGEGLLARAAGLAGERFWFVARYFGSLLVREHDVTHGLVWASLALVALGPRQAIALPYRTAAIAAALGVLGFFVVFLGTHQPLLWHLSTAASRLIFQVLPVLALWIAATSEAIISRPTDPQ